MKKISFLLIAALAVCLSAAPAYSEEDAAQKTHARTESEKHTLNNGRVVIIREVPHKGLVSVDVRVQAGSAHEGRFCGSGTAHFVEHMIFKGTRRRKPGQIEKEIRSLGGAINGGTSFDYTSFYITIPSSRLERALDILSDSLFNASFHPAELEQERMVILKEK